MRYRYVCYGGALNGRNYEFAADHGPEFTLPPDQKEWRAYLAKRKAWDPSEYQPEPVKPPRIIYHALWLEVIEGHKNDQNKDGLIEVRHCVPKEWGTDPETVAKHLMRFMARMNSATVDAVTKAPMINPEIVRLGKFIGVFHR